MQVVWLLPESHFSFSGIRIVHICDVSGDGELQKECPESDHFLC